ncbi:hypothetical protein CEP52_003344 [Fusarium oligoseptatum]|uniref:N-acetyltransferase domain-containing protein n=1 Tax=Fusarium oligoseptatum TaxID=2604345 RepID=A0A428U9J8_9HYPO|nr:hypothetical protein CEP52_003344 [Fusarium oligoseptatum]
MANLQFRIATPDDAPQLQQLIQAAFRAEDSRKDWVGDAELAANFCISVDEVLPKITSPDSEMIMAFDDNGALAGTVGVFHRNDDLARLFYLAVDQTLHRGGIGRQVLEYAEGYCQRTWGVKKLGLDALTLRKELISWYMRRGYVPTGEITPFPVDKLNGRALPEGLGFVEMEKEARVEA